MKCKSPRLCGIASRPCLLTCGVLAGMVALVPFSEVSADNETSEVAAPVHDQSLRPTGAPLAPDRRALYLHIAGDMLEAGGFLRDSRELHRRADELASADTAVTPSGGDHGRDTARPEPKRGGDMRPATPPPSRRTTAATPATSDQPSPRQIAEAHERTMNALRKQVEAGLSDLQKQTGRAVHELHEQGEREIDSLRKEVGEEIGGLDERIDAEIGEVHELLEAELEHLADQVAELQEMLADLAGDLQDESESKHAKPASGKRSQ